MFENKNGDQSTSPPSRGRSPNPSEFSNGSRPVSKVRASFVAVERPGENGGPTILGLRRASEVSSMSGIQENAVVDSETFEKPSGTRGAAQPASNPKPTSNGVDEGEDLGNILKGSAFVENTPPKPPSDVTNFARAPTSGQVQQKNPVTSSSKSKDQSHAPSMIEKMQEAKQSKPGPPPTTTLKTTETAQPVKAPPTRQINPKAVPKSPIVTQPSPRTPTSPKLNIKGGPAKIRGVMDSAKEAQKARDTAKEQGAQQEKAQAPASAKEQGTKQEKSQPSAPKVDTQPKSRPAPAAAKKEQTPTSPKSVRSPTTVKPKPATVPGKLPAAATATTASAAAKHDAQHSPTDPDHKPAAKKPSTLSMRPPRASTSSTTSTLSKKASRASLTNGHQRPQSRTSTAKPDEGFLARMMRPTASSAQKGHDKVQATTPPKTKSKTMAPPKAKQSTKQEPPPKMHLDARKETGTEDKENDGDHKQDQDEGTLPAVAHPSPFDVVKQDPMNGNAGQEPTASDSTTPAEHEQVNGAAQEVY